MKKQFKRATTILIVAFMATTILSTSAQASHVLSSGTITQTSIQLNWTDHGNEQSYNVKVKLTTESVFANAATLPKNTLSYNVTGLTPGTAYDLRVNAIAKNGTATPSNTITRTTLSAPITPQCSDGINNDGAEDSLIDYPADPGCTSASDTTESPNPPPPSPECSDGINNDPTEDTLIDFPNDPGCSSSTDTTELGNPPPPGVQYGPAGTGTLIERVEAIRDGTMPQAVSCPGGTQTVVNPGENIQADINAAGANGVLCFMPGVYTISTQLVPLSGQDWYLTSTAGYTRGSAGNAILDAAGSSIAAIVNSTQTATNVTVRGGVFKNAPGSTDANGKAFQIVGTPGWLVEDVILDNNRFGISFNAGSDNGTIRRAYVVNSNKYGVTANASQGVVFDRVRVAFSNDLLNDAGIDAGGSKFPTGAQVTVSKSWFHDNFGFAVWVDSVGHHEGGQIFSDNVVENNDRAGLFFEGVGGGSKMLRNYVVNNGNTNTIGGQAPSAQANVQIRITGSDSRLGTVAPGVTGEVAFNYVDYNLTQTSTTGYLFRIWNHDFQSGALRANCFGWNIHDNQFWMRNTANKQMVGGFDTDTEANSIFDPANNIDFVNNEYQVASTSVSSWVWDNIGGVGVLKNYTEWRTYHPGDDNPLV